MRLTAGVFVLLIFSIQICNAQQYYPNVYLDPFFFYNGPSTATEGTGNIYLNNNNDAFSTLYNPALSSRSDNLRFSYSTSREFNYYVPTVYNNFGVDVPVKNIGTFSLIGRYYDNIYYPEGPIFEQSINYTSYNLNYSRDIYRGLSMGMGLNYLKKEVMPYKNLNRNYYSFKIGASYIYYLPTSDNYSQYVMANLSILNIPIFYSKKILYSDYPLPQIDNLSIGYVSKYGKSNELDVFQTDIQIEYSDLLNSRYYNTISIGAEIKFMEIASIRLGYYNFTDENISVDETTYGFGLSLPLRLVANIPIVAGIDYSRSQYPQPYLDSFLLYFKFDLQ
jgi:hypothetical protein